MSSRPSPLADFWNSWAVPWKPVVSVAGSVSRAHAVHLRQRVAERHPRPQVERQRHRRQLPGVVDRERADAAVDRHERVDRHQVAAGPADVQPRQRVRVAPELRRQLQDHLVLVVRGVDRRDLPGPVGVGQRVLDLPGGHAERRRPVAVDPDVELRAAEEQVAGHVAQLGQLAQLLLQLRERRTARPCPARSG